MNEELIEKMHTNISAVVDINKAILKNSIKDIDISGFQLVLLRFISTQDNLNVGKIVKMMECDQGNLSATLKKMEKKGYIERQRNPLDERQVMIHISHKGQEIIDILNHEVSHFICQMTQYIPIEEIERAINQLEHIAQIGQKILKENKKEEK